MNKRTFNPDIIAPICKRGCKDMYVIDSHDNIVEHEGVPIRCQCYFENKYLDANIGFAYWPLTVENFDGHPNDLSRVKELMRNIESMYKRGQGAYIHGGNGSGKSTLVMLLLKFVLHYTKCTAMFAPMSELVILNSRVISGFSDQRADDAIRIIKNVDFLGIDDIGKEFDDGKDKARATLNSIIRYRDLWNKPTIYTANTPIEELRLHYGDSNYSIMEGRSEIISMEYDRDYRKEKKMEDGQ